MLTEEFVQAQTPEHQVICNQLNRRTEFTVLRTTYGMFDKDGNLTNPPKKKSHTEYSDDDGFDIEL